MLKSQSNPDPVPWGGVALQTVLTSGTAHLSAHGRCPVGAATSPDAERREECAGMRAHSRPYSPRAWVWWWAQWARQFGPLPSELGTCRTWSPKGRRNGRWSSGLAYLGDLGSRTGHLDSKSCLPGLLQTGAPRSRSHPEIRNTDDDSVVPARKITHSAHLNKQQMLIVSTISQRLFQQLAPTSLEF